MIHRTTLWIGAVVTGAYSLNPEIGTEKPVKALGGLEGASDVIAAGFDTVKSTIDDRVKSGSLGAGGDDGR